MPQPLSHRAKLCVLGAGAWGTALAIQAARAGNAVALWARDPARAAAIAEARENARHLPGARISAAVTVTGDLEAATQGALLAIVAVPAQHMRAVLERLPPGAAALPLVIGAKGVEQGTLKLPLEVAAEARPEAPGAVLSGPNFAHEVAAGLPAAAVVASRDAALRERVGDLLGSPGFRLYGGDDPMGVQVGGAAKNVIAIAAVSCRPPSATVRRASSARPRVTSAARAFSPRPAPMTAPAAMAMTFFAAPPTCTPIGSSPP